MIKKPDKISLLILGIITVLAVIYGMITWREVPELYSFSVDETFRTPYQFRVPDEVYDLPKELEEISGLAFWKDEQLLSIQDEDGEVFVYDLSRRAITEEMKFAKDRDYEGVSRIESQIYVLERDGDIHHFTYEEGKDEYDAEKFESDFSYRNDTEGIAYDPVTGMFLIAPKEEQLGDDSGGGYVKNIYLVDPVSGQVRDKPFLSIDQYEIGEMIYGKRDRYLMKPSGVAVDPETNNIYVLASVGKLLIICDRDGKILHVERLDERLLSQPEGITFAPNGDLFISSEGRNGRPIIARYTAQPIPENE